MGPIAAENHRYQSRRRTLQGAFGIHRRGDREGERRAVSRIRLALAP